ncbi:hypothetical protein D9757_004605 [Collybiopsis confluens]|uniref:Uncharacterized protein n=1 Tax=Collybiopsis confluens TaxID=2823264 RepID=A0A8H5MBL5_9AGAR|nr:hypothetical protein D9757_004605 [Collybiopsis confluens]
MSFTSFRLGEVITNPPPHLMHLQATTNMYAEPQQNQQPSQFTAIDNTNSFPNNTTKISPASSTKQPYGSGDTDDGYTLVFPNLTAFHQWRQREEEAQVVEFVKGDTHGSKAIPPRFKDHTKLVCARHSRSGRKKYVKKHPERVRKVPSRKLEGQGCPASISFKTYFDSEEVRACYNSQHSHETGPANLPYTRRGRKAVAEAEKKKAGKNIRFADDHHLVNDPTASTPTAETSSVTQAESSSPSNYNSAVSMIAPLPSASQSPYQSSPQQQSYNYQPQYQYASPSAPPPPQYRCLQL